MRLNNVAGLTVEPVPKHAEEVAVISCVDVCDILEIANVPRCAPSGARSLP